MRFLIDLSGPMTHSNTRPPPGLSCLSGDTHSMLTVKPGSPGQDSNHAIEPLPLLYGHLHFHPLRCRHHLVLACSMVMPIIPCPSSVVYRATVTMSVIPWLISFTAIAARRR